jgi:hypothetical protein
MLDFKSKSTVAPSLGLPHGPSLALHGPSLASPYGPSLAICGPSLSPPPCLLFSCLSLLLPLLSSSTTYVYCLNQNFILCFVKGYFKSFV